MRLKQTGFTLIELIIFIVIIGILATGIFATFNQVLVNAQNPEIVVKATQLAQGRMNLILGQFKNAGFNTSDPCGGGGPTSVCSLPSGFSAQSSITNISTDEKNILVTVTGPQAISIKLQARVAND